MRHIKKILTTLCFLLFLPATAEATVINFDTHVTGSTSYGRDSLTASLTLEQVGADVVFTLRNEVAYNSTTYGSFISALWINSKRDDIQFYGPLSSQAMWQGSRTNNAGYNFSYQFLFPTRNSRSRTVNRFVSGDVAIWAARGALVDDFLVTTLANGKPEAMGMLHLQGLGFCAYDSAKYVGTEPPQAVPEPATLAILLFAGLGLAYASRRNQLKKMPSKVK